MNEQPTALRLEGFWLAPAVFGALLILFGVLVWVVPRLLQFIVASAFILAGISMITLAWGMRARVTYRRVDRETEIL